MQQNVEDFIKIFTSILYEAMPFIVLGALIAGILEELVPQQLVARLVPKNRSLAIVLSAALGILFPMCECGIVPVMRRLLRKGLPLGCCISYMLGGPIINIIVILSTVVAFPAKVENATWLESFQQGTGPMMAVLRVAGGFFVAVITALIVEVLYRKYGDELLTPLARPNTKLSLKGVSEPPASESPAELHHEQEEITHVKPSAWQRLSNIAETALHDFVDITVFLILGAILAGATRMFLSHGDIERLSTSFPVIVILAMMGLAILLCLCSEADAFVAASFTSLPPSAKLAFLVLGPMLDIKLYLMYTRVFRRKLIFTVFGSVIVFSFVYALGVHVFWLTLPKATG